MLSVSGLYQLVQTIAELRILCQFQIALKHAVLHPLTIGREDGVDFGAAFVFGNVVGDDDVHRLLQHQWGILLRFTHQVLA
jgi:hypothetical protein